MKLNDPIILNPPPYSDQSGQTIHPEPIILTELNPIYYDDPAKKKLFAKLDTVPWSLSLIDNDEEYDALGDYTVSQRQQLFIKKLGSNPSEKLQSLFPPTLEQNPYGPGTILSSMIKKFGIHITPDCSCMKRALSMNKEGPDWCEQNIDKILEWLKEESKKRKIPFIGPAAKILVQQAIQKSRKMLQSNVT
jgi:hypothetical protein